MSVNRVVLDGAEQPGKTVRLVDDRNKHNMEQMLIEDRAWVFPRGRKETA